MKDKSRGGISPIGLPNLPIIGGFILLTLILGITRLGFIPVPTEAKFATIMHLPTIIICLVEGWLAGMIVGTVFGLTSMYTATTSMGSDFMVSMVPRMLIGMTTYAAYMATKGSTEYFRLGVGAIVGTLTNTIFYLVFSVILGYLEVSVAFNIGLTHGLPEVIVAIIIVIPSVLLVRTIRNKLNKYHY
jgi:uncharacterized membrane protein